MSELKPCPSIELSGGLRVLVSEEDYERVSAFKWYAHQARGCRYAARKPTKGGIIYMHRFILECPEGMEVDHINGATLDNRRENLRIVTHRENLRNQAPQAGASSRFKGVYWSADDDCWRVQIKDAGRMRGVGGIAREDVAAAIYDLLALDRFGEHARFNNPHAVAAWNTRSPSPSSGVDVLREKAKLADEYAAWMKELRDEDGDIYGWDDAHSGNTIVGMEIGDVKDWLARYEALSNAATTTDARAPGGNDAT